jgi:16S rRNA (cytosine967-C5)-methyltransferase
VVESHRSLFRTDVFARGYVEMQDEASQLVAELVAPPPRTFVVDACAGAGGKTLALAALLRGKGQVLALDASEARLAQLRRRARRAEASNVRAVACDLLDAAALRGHAERAGSLAQRVLLDAPCSGLGAIRRNPELRWRLRPGELNRLLDLQQALARAAATLVLPHGRLVFATCSFLPSEGERAFDRFLQENADYVSVSVRDVLGRTRTEGVATNDGRYLRTWRFDGTPDGGDEGMDGFFAGVARRRAQPSSGGP